MKPSFPRGAAAALAAVVMWGAQFPVAKSAFEVLDPVQLSAFRYGVATLLLLAWMLARQGPGVLSTQGRFRQVTALGVIGMSGSPLLVFAGLLFTRPEHAAVIVALQPSMTALADWALRGRRPANFTVACIAVAFLGVVTVVTKGQFVLHAGGRELLGDLMVLAGAACWVVYTMGTERLGGWPTLKITLLTLIAGSLGMVVLAGRHARVRARSRCRRRPRSRASGRRSPSSRSAACWPRWCCGTGATASSAPSIPCCCSTSSRW